MKSRRRWRRWILVAVVLAAVGCRTAPITGRRQLLMVPEKQEIEMGLTAFQQTLASEKPSSNSQYNAVVQRVGARIAQAANRPDYDWEFRVIESPEMNAFCLPGGKVAIYEGIMPVCQNEAGIAVVLSHEIAHALARHGGERMSHGYMVTGVGQAVSYATRSQEEFMRQRISSAYGMASKYGFVLPYSRKHESEADHMGILLMAQAGYDPSEAPRFWTRFGSMQGGAKPPEFLSTHPADERRAHDLEALLPQAMAIYEQIPEKLGIGETLAVAAVAAPAPAVASLPAQVPANSGGAVVNGAAADAPQAFLPGPPVQQVPQAFAPPSSGLPAAAGTGPGWTATTR